MRRLLLMLVPLLMLSALPAMGECASVQLAWDTPAPCSPVACPVETYNVYRAVNGAASLRVGTVLAPTQTFSDAVPAKGNNCYTVRAANGVGESIDSNMVCLLLPELPKTPLNVKGTLSP